MLCNLHGRPVPSPAGGWPLSAPPGTCNSPALLDGLWWCLIRYCCSLAAPYLGHKERSMVSPEAKVWLPVCARQDQRNNCESGMRCTRWAPLQGRRHCSVGPQRASNTAEGKDVAGGRLLGDGSQRLHGSQACVPCPCVSFLCSWGSTSTPRLWECCEDGRGAGKAAAMLTEVCRGTRECIRRPESLPCEIRLRVTAQ